MGQVFEAGFYYGRMGSEIYSTFESVGFRFWVSLPVALALWLIDKPDSTYERHIIRDPLLQMYKLAVLYSRSLLFIANPQSHLSLSFLI